MEKLPAFELPQRSPKQRRRRPAAVVPDLLEWRDKMEREMTGGEELQEFTVKYYVLTILQEIQKLRVNINK